MSHAVTRQCDEVDVPRAGEQEEDFDKEEERRDAMLLTSILWLKIV